MTVYILTKAYTVPGDKGTHDKLNQYKVLEIQTLDNIFQNLYYEYNQEGARKNCAPKNALVKMAPTYKRAVTAGANG